MINAVLLVSHGSRSSKTKIEVEALVGRLKQSNVVKIVHFAFLELEIPDILQGIDRCVQDGASRVIIVLNFLNSGKHVDEDIPAIVGEAQRRYSAVEFHMTRPIGQHPGIDALFIDLISKALD